jgi:hypothetical protein
MHLKMSKPTKDEVLNKLRGRYARAGQEHKTKIIDQVLDLFDYHRKSAIRALRRGPRPQQAPAFLGRPLKYDPAVLLPPLKVIWLASQQLCGKLLAVALADWVPAYEAYHRKLTPEVRASLLAASPATLDRLLAPARVQHGRTCGGTRPGTLLRQQIPLRGGLWDENLPGYLEIDTVALCGGRLDGDHVWMLDTIDLCTTWVEARAVWNRGQDNTLAQIQDIETRLPFALLGLDSDNGGEFLNWHLYHWCAQHAAPVKFTRSRPYKKDDNAHSEQKNWTHIRQWFGYERHDQPELVPLLNALTTGAWGQLVNLFRPALKLESKVREGSRIKRHYGEPQTPYARVQASAHVSLAKKTELQTLKARLNPFELAAQVERELKAIEAIRCRRKA